FVVKYTTHGHMMNGLLSQTRKKIDSKRQRSNSEDLGRMKHTFFATSSVLPLIIVLALQTVIVTGKNSEHFADIADSSWALFDNCQQLGTKINNGQLKIYGQDIEDNLVDLANAVSDAVGSLLIMEDSGDALFRRFKWQIHEIIDIFNDIEGKPDGKTIEDIMNRLESISTLAENVGIRIKDARIRMERVVNLKKWTLNSLRNGQREGSNALVQDRARFNSWILWVIDILTGRAATRELRQGQLNEALLQIGNTIKVINNMNGHVAKISRNLNRFAESITQLKADLSESIAHERPSRAMLEFLTDTLEDARKKYAAFKN
ncbi:5206_t:CDS:2, partial [Paraglomus brasilianum]